MAARSARVAEPVVKEFSYGSTESASQASSRRTIVIAASVMCVMQLVEAMASETYDATQIFFLDSLGIDTTLNNGMQFAQDRIYMVCLLLCGKLGDNGLGRFETMSLGTVVYLFGTLMVCLATHPWVSRIVWYFIGIFVLLPFAAAGISANVVNFGADQYDLSVRSHHERQRAFFWWYGASICGGEALAAILMQCFGVASTDSQYIASLIWTPDEVTAPEESYWAVLLITAFIFLAAIICFRCAKQCYSAKSREQLPGSAIVAVTQFLVSITHKGQSWQGFVILAAKVVGVTVYVAQAALFWCSALSGPLSFCSAVGVVFSAGGIIYFCRDPSWLDGVVQPENQVLTVTEVKTFLRLLPLLVATELSYGVLNSMADTWYSRQACQMDLRVAWGGTWDADSPQMFVGFFTIFYCLIVVFATPLFLWYGLPRLRQACEAIGLQHRDWTNFLVGLGFGVASALVAAHLELCRKSSAPLDMISECAPVGSSVRSLSGFWMCLPYALMSMSTMLTVPTMLMIGYRQVPRNMRSITAVTFLFMQSASDSIITFLSLAMVEYTPKDLDTGNLEYLYFVGIIVSLSLLGLFSFLLKGFEERNFPDTVIRINDSDDESVHMAPAA